VRVLREDLVNRGRSGRELRQVEVIEAGHGIFVAVEAGDTEDHIRTGSVYLTWMRERRIDGFEISILGDFIFQSFSCLSRQWR
jgi:hypothetical protein